MAPAVVGYPTPGSCARLSSGYPVAEAIGSPPSSGSAEEGLEAEGGRPFPVVEGGRRVAWKAIGREVNGSPS